MELRSIKNSKKFGLKIKNKFAITLEKDDELKAFIRTVEEKCALYIIGGFIRDVINDVESRDLDLVSLLDQDELSAIIYSNLSRNQIKRNRLGGFKLNFTSMEVDIWSVDESWSIKKGITTISGKERVVDNKKVDIFWLKIIANEAFLNFDSLSLNTKTGNCNLKNYNNCISKGQLDLIHKRNSYLDNNPTNEANILRVFFLQKTFNFIVSDSLKKYILKQTKILAWLNQNVIDHFKSVQSKYKKYGNLINEFNFFQLVNSMKKSTDLDFNQQT